MCKFALRTMHSFQQYNWQMLFAVISFAKSLMNPVIYALRSSLAQTANERNLHKKEAQLQGFIAPLLTIISVSLKMLAHDVNL